MASVEDRVGDLVEKLLGISDRAALDSDLSTFGVNSMDGVSFIKAVSKEFGVEISPEVARGFTTLRDLINHLGG